jgi:DNA topoisomerase VI subunit A
MQHILMNFFVFLEQNSLELLLKILMDYKLPTHPLKEVDIKKIKDLIKNDPFIKDKS